MWEEEVNDNAKVGRLLAFGFFFGSRKMRNVLLSAVLAAALLLPCPSVNACTIQYTVSICSDGNSLTFTDTVVSNNIIQVIDVDISNSLIKGNGDIGGFEKLILTINSDPEVEIDFWVRAGKNATTFSITSEILSFAPLLNPTASASAELTLTEGSNSTASITGLFANNSKIHQARYNGDSVFADLLNNFSVAGTNSESKPAVGYETITGSVSSIESEFKFTLSAKDYAEGMSTFFVEAPEPATIVLLTLGSFLLIVKNKKTY